MAALVLDFDEFARALRDAVESARQEVARAYGEQPDLPGRVWQVAVRDSDGTPRSFEADSRDWRVHRYFTVTEFSVELDCVVRHAGAAREGEPVSLSVASWRPERRPGVDRLRLTYRGDGALDGAAFLNDELFKVFD